MGNCVYTFVYNIDTVIDRGRILAGAGVTSFWARQGIWSAFYLIKLIKKKKNTQRLKVLNLAVNTRLIFSEF